MIAHIFMDRVRYELRKVLPDVTVRRTILYLHVGDLAVRYDVQVRLDLKMQPTSDYDVIIRQLQDSKDAVVIRERRFRVRGQYKRSIERIVQYLVSGYQRYRPTPFSPLKEALEAITGETAPSYLVGVYRAKELDDQVGDELQNWCGQNARPEWSTGLGILEAAELMVREAVDNDNIPEKVPS